MRVLLVPCVFSLLHAGANEGTCAVSVLVLLAGAVPI
jgi:hypothetical protein